MNLDFQKWKGKPSLSSAVLIVAADSIHQNVIEVEKLRPNIGPVVSRLGICKKLGCWCKWFIGLTCKD